MFGHDEVATRKARDVREARGAACSVRRASGGDRSTQLEKRDRAVCGLRQQLPPAAGSPLS
jgi:hypothetical protein